MPTVLKSQNTVLIGQGATTNYRLPVNMFYNYSLTQQIYTAEEIGYPMGGQIHSISFRYAYSNAFSLDGIRVYMLNTDKSSFESNTDMVPISESDKVYEGVVSASGPGLVTVEFDTPFEYDGRNLLVCFYDPIYGYPGISYQFYCSYTTDGVDRSIAYYSDSQIPDINNIHSFSGLTYKYSFRADILLDITPASQSVTVGDGAYSYYYSPIYSYVERYAFVEQIYTAEEIGQPNGGSISSISFNMETSNTRTVHVSIYMKNVAKSYFADHNDYESVSPSDLVYDGDFTFHQGWNTFHLDTPFAYDGSQNLMVGLHGIYDDWGVNNFYYTYKGNSVLIFQDDDVDPDPTNLGAYPNNAGVTHYRANMKLDITPFDEPGEVVEVGDGASSSYYTPYTSNYNYSFVEQIYTAEEIGQPDGGTINSISFQMNTTQTSDPDHITVFLKHVAKSKFAYGLDYEEVTPVNIVYDGEVTFTQGWTTIPLDIPFVYDGTSNLMVAVHENTPGTNVRTFRYTEKDSTVKTYYSDASDIDPYNLASYTGNSTLRNDRSNIRFEMGSSSPNYVAIGAGTNNRYDLPVNMYYNYSLTQQIYTAEEIGSQNGTIHAVSFYYNYDMPFSIDGVQMYLQNTSKSSFSSNTDMVPISASDKVFEGTFSASGPGWVTIELDTPFDYTEGSNLLLCMYDTIYGYPGSAYKFRCSSTSESTALTYYSDTDLPDLNDVSSFSDHELIFDYHNDIRLHGITPNSCPVPDQLTVTERGRTAELSWAGGSSKYTVRYKSANVHLQEDFEGGTLPAGWSSESTVGSSAWSVGVGDYSTSTGSHAGQYNAKIYSTGASASTYLITPVMNLGGVRDAVLNFWYINRLSGVFHDELTVYYRINGGAWQELFNASESHSSWTMESIPLSGLADGYQIGFKVTSQNGNGVGLDDIVIFTPASDTWQTANTNTNTHTLNWLDPNIAYLWQVKGHCGQGVSAWSCPSVFSTGCDLFDIPYSEGFEGVTSPFLCWTPVYCAPEPSALYSTYHSGYYNLFFEYDSTGLSIIALPGFNQPISELQISFWIETYANYYGAGTFEVGYMTDLSDTSTFVPVNIYYADDWTASEFILKTEYFPGAPDGAYIAFRKRSMESGFRWFVDDVVVSEADVCRIPNHLTANNITLNSAVLNWDARGGETAWNLYYKKSDASSYTQISNVTKPYTLAGLDASTQYLYYVEAVCGSTTSEPSETYSFTTVCAPDAIPYTTGFESSDDILCWTQIQGYTEIRYYYAHSGSNRLNFLGYNTRIIALPQFNQPINNLQLSFWTRPEGNYSGCGTFSVGYMTDLSDPTTFTVENTYRYDEWTSSANYMQKVVYFTDAPAGAYIAFRHDAAEPYYYWYVDDVEVSEAPACISPDNLSARDVTPQTAVLKWRARGHETAWNLYYKPSFESTYIQIPNVTSPYTLTGLSPITQYDCYVEAVCGSTTEPSETYSFSTLCTPSTIPYSYNFESPESFDCWTVLNGDVGIKYASGSSNHTLLGSYSLEVKGTVALPQFDQPISGLQLSFWLLDYNSDSDFTVGYITDLEDLSTFVPVETYSNEYNFVQKVVYFTGAPANARMAFRANDYYSWYVDDIVVSEAADCKVPHLLTATNITIHTAELDWTPRGSETAWNLYYKKTNDSAYTKLSNVTRPYSLSGLDGGNTYNCFVEAVCSGGQVSDPSDPISFNTSCDPVAIPYSYDFENPLPSLCWKNVLGTTGQYNYGPSSQHTEGGTYCLMFKWGDTLSVYAFPEFDHPISDLQLSFWTRPGGTSSSYGTFSVGYVTDIDDPSSFVTVSSHDATEWTSYSYMQLIEDFIGAPAGARIAFRHKTSDFGYNWLVDDVEVTLFSGCKTPHQLTATGITSNSAVLGWTPRGTEAAWNLYYKKSSEDSYTQIANVTDNPYTLTGLESGTSYDFYVEALCGTSVSSPTNHFPFNTECGVASVPYVYDFENEAPFLCWTGVNGNVLRYSDSRYAHSTPAFLDFESTSSMSLQSTVVLPPFNQPISSLQIQFWTRPEYLNDDDCGTFSVGYMTDPADVTTFTAVSTYNAIDWASGSDYVQMTEFFIGAPAGSRIAFQHNSKYSYREWYLDDIEVTLASACPGKPTNLTVSDIAVNSVVLSWAAAAGETAWDLYYKKSDESSYTQIANVTDNPYTLTGLEANTNYIFYVEAACGSESSFPSTTASFTTECAVDLPYSYDFETLPPFQCWNIMSGTWGLNTDAIDGELTSLLYSRMNTTIPTVIALPLFDPPVSNLQLRFRITPTGNDVNYGFFEVGYLTDPSDASSFVVVNTYSYNEWSSPTFYQKTEYFTGAPAGARIAFRLRDNDYGLWYVDDVEVTVSTGCPAPHLLSVTNITASSADLGWTPRGSETQWNLYYKKTTDEDYTLIPALTSSSSQLTGLTPNTQYEFFVAPRCGSTDAGDSSEVFAFITECVPVTVPYTYDFETVVPFTCWQPISGVTIDNWSNNSTYGGSGNNYLLLENSYSKFVILPDFEEPIRNLAITFLLRPEIYTYSQCGTFEVGYLTDIADTSTFVPVHVYSYNEWNDDYYKSITDYFTGAPDNAYIAFRSNSSYYLGWYVDDVEVTLSPDCKVPYSLTATNVTDNSATLGWTPRGSETAWNLYYKMTSEDAYTTVPNVTANPYTLTGLASATDYEYYVTAVCGTGESDTSWTCSFSTECVVEAIPYAYDCEDEVPFLCWKLVNGDVYRGDYYHSAHVGLTFIARGSSALRSTILLPKFAVPTGNLKLNFWTAPEYPYSSYCGTFSVGYMTDPSDVTTFTAIATYQADDWSDYEFQKKTVFFTGVPADARIAFQHNSNGTFYNWYVDDIEVLNAASDCTSPDYFACTGVSSNTASLSWSSSPSTTAWNLYYKKSTEPTYTEVQNLTSNSYTLTGLAPGTSYKCYVVAVCDEALFPSAMLTFETDCGLYATLPYEYDVESSLPLYCWNNVYGDFSTHGYNHTPDGYYGLQLDNCYGNYLAMPRFEEATNTLKISFWLLPDQPSSKGDYTFSVGYMSNLSDTSTFVAVNTYRYDDWVPSSSGYYDFIQKTEYFTDAPAGSYIAFRKSKDCLEWYVDDIAVTVASECRAPHLLTATDITENSAVLGWTPRGSVTAWNLYYRKTADDFYTLVPNIATTAYTLTGLEQNTDYDFYVKAVCGTGDGDSSAAHAFTTTCGTETIPYTCDFETVAPLRCWNTVDGYVTWNYVSSGVCYGLEGNTTTVTLPTFDRPIRKLQISFWIDPHDYYVSNFSSFSVGYMTDPSDVSSFVPVNTYYNTEITNFVQKTAFFPDAPDGACIAFQENYLGSSSSSGWYWYLDDVEVTLSPFCDAPENLYVTDVSMSGATLSWSSDASAWQICVDGDESNLIDVTSHSYTLSGLELSTDYTVKVRAVCDGVDTSDWSSTLTFTTAGTMVEICSYSDINEYLPSCSHSRYSLSEQIYTAAEIGQSGDIYSIAFYNTGVERTRNWDVYLKNTTKSTFSGVSDWEYIHPSYLVFSGDVTMAANQWTVINFDTPFTYNGTDNLMVVVDDNTGSYDYYNRIAYYVSSAPGQSIEYYYDYVNYDPQHPGDIIGNVHLRDVKNCIQFDFNPCVKPSGLTASHIGNSSAIIEWNEDGSASDWILEYSSSETFSPSYSPISVSGTPQFTISGLLPDTTYYVRVKADCGSGDGSNWSSMSFTTYACEVPSDVHVVSTMTGEAEVSWEGHSDSFSVRYRPAGSSSWNTETGIIENHYTLTGLPVGDYELEVASSCDMSIWTPATFAIMEVFSTANWYCYGYSSEVPEWDRHFLSFTMQNPAAVTTATDELTSLMGTGYTDATAFADGYVWCITVDGDLTRATLDDASQSISAFETVAAGFESNYTYSMSYNPDNGKIYYVSDNVLKFFDPANPTGTLTTIDTMDGEYFSITINQYGEAYCLKFPDVYLYQLNLNNATATPVGNIGLFSEDVTSMAFDLNTDELFLAYYNYYTSTGKLYKVNPATADICYIGGADAYFYTLFMGGNLCSAPEDLAVSNFTNTSATASWTGTADSYTLRYKPVSGDWTVVTDITDTFYLIDGLTPGDYEVEVAASCDETNTVSATFNIMEVLSTANWYTYPVNTDPHQSWEFNFVSFSMGNPAMVTPTTNHTPYSIYSATYCNGYVWSFHNGDLIRAVLDNQNKDILDFETVVPGFDTQAASSMSYNPVDGRIYYSIFETTNHYKLKSFDPEQPDDIQNIGTIELGVSQIAINSMGEAYGINNSWLYRINLTNASTITVGKLNIGEVLIYTRTLAFDTETDELFMAYSHTPDFDGLYKVNTETAQTQFIGRVGNVNMAYCCLFMGSDYCFAPEDLTVTNITTDGATLGWESDATSWSIMLDETVLSGITNNPYVFTGFLPGTEHTVKVRANCEGIGESDWSDSLTFTTDPSIIPSYVTITGETAVCPGSTTVLTATTDVEATYFWSTGATSASVTVGAGEYSVTVTSTTGDELSETITVEELPTYNVTDEATICANELPYDWNGVTFTEAGTQTVTLSTVNNCDSVVTMTLTVHAITAGIDEETACDSYTWMDGNTYTASTTEPTYTLTNAAGCDSVVTLHLMVHQSTTGVDEVTACDSYTWIDGNTYTASTTEPTYTLTNAAGCDSVVTLHLTVRQSSTGIDEVTACGSYTWMDGNTYTASTTEPTYTLTNAAGCDSVVTLHLTVNPVYELTDTREVCPAALPYEWSGVTFTEAGTQTVTLQTVHGCDSVVTMTLEVNEAYNITENRTICATELPYVWNDVTFTEAGTQTVTFTASNNCDSVVTMILTVNIPDYTIFYDVACDSYIWNEETYTQTGDYTQTFTNIDGCDSVVTLHLTVNYAVTSEFAEIVCDSYVWNDQTYTTSGDYTQTFTNVNNCDSVVTLHLTVNNSTTGDTTAVACVNFTWHGNLYTESGDYSVTLTNAAGCDSVVTLHLTLNDAEIADISEVACDSYVWNDQTYTASGDYTQTFINASGCDSVVTLHLTVNYADTAEFAEIACDSFTWNDSTYTESGDYTSYLTNAAGCDSVVTLHLTLNYAETAEFAEVVCDSYEWNDQTYTVSGDYMQTFTNASGCDSVVTLHLTVNYAETAEFAETVCDSYEWNDQTYTVSGDYTQTFTNAVGCDSVVTLHLTVLPSFAVTDNRAVCVTQLPYEWNGVTFTAAGTQTATLQAENGCDSVVTMTLTVGYPQMSNVETTICQSELPYEWNGVTFTAAGSQIATLSATNGCDSMVVMTLTVNPAYNVTDEATICASELPYEWNGVTFTEAGTQAVTLQTVNGCDSVVTMILTVNYSTIGDTTAVACDSFTWNGTAYTETGDYEYTMTNVAGCDSVVTLRLTLNYAETAEFAETVCDSFTWNGTAYTESGDYTSYLTNASGCDSVVTLHLTVNYADTVEFAEIACDSYEWNDQTYTVSGDYTQTFTNVAGCDSVVTLHLTLNYAETAEFAETVCDSFTWNGIAYTETGEYTQTFTNAAGCDSVVTLHLTLNYAETAEFAEIACDSFTWNDSTYTESGDYVQTFTNAAGCDSVVTLHLTLNYAETAEFAETVCDSFTWNGIAYTETGDYVQTFTNAAGCDSVVTLHLTLNYAETAEFAEVACDSFTWNDSTYTESGDYTQTFTNAAGCDSVVTLHLTLNYAETAEFAEIACDSFTWNEETYTESGDYTQTFTNAAGCDSIVTLHLTLNYAETAEFAETVCDSFIWNGIAYTESGDYTQTFTNAAGCDSVVTLHLTINNSTTGDTTAVACESFTWYDSTYTVSGDYTSYMTTANGCDSVVTLHLTVNYSTTGDTTAVACDSFTWNGIAYTESGDYTSYMTTANGCDSVVTLHLTVNYPLTAEFTVETSDSCYDWNGVLYCASGDYTQTLTAANGCDSVVTLHLTTSVGIENHEAAALYLAPNPTKNISRIYGVGESLKSVEVFDMRGRLITKVYDNEIDVTTLPTGVYLVKVYTDKGVTNLKLVRQ